MNILLQTFLISCIPLTLTIIVLHCVNSKVRLSKEQKRFVNNLKRLGYEDYEMDHYLPDEYDSCKKLRKINRMVERGFKNVTKS